LKKSNDKKLMPITPAFIGAIEPSSDDLTFTHSVFSQCFFPLRKLKNNAKSYTSKHGKASLFVKAGEIADPDNEGHFIELDVPHGAAADLSMSHINNHIIRAGSIDEACEVNMGDNMRAFFERYNLPVCGSSARQVRTQVMNIAHATMRLGVWSDSQVKQLNFPCIAEEIDFWVEKDSRQYTLWQPRMLVNRKYVEAIRERGVPHDMRALIGLYETPRALQVYKWLAYRLPLIRDESGVFVPFYGENGLHSVFGRGLDKYRFKQTFLEDTLPEALKWYQTATLSIDDKRNGLRLYNSPSPVPKELLEKKSLFFPKGR